MNRLKRLVKPRTTTTNNTSPRTSAPSSTPIAAVPVPGTHLNTTNNNMIREMILIYDGDGTLSGEIVYMTKKLLGLGHCSACEITHGPRTEKPEFTVLKNSGWSVPLRNIHRNEMEPELRAVAAGNVPCLAAKTDDATYFILLDSHSLDQCHGDVNAFQDIVNKSISNRNLKLPPMSCAKPANVVTPASNAPDNDEAVVPQQ